MRAALIKKKIARAAAALCAAFLLLALCAPAVFAHPPHTWGEDWYHDDAHHWRKCTECDEISEYGEHTGGHATCIEAATCAVCGALYGAPTGEHTEGTPANCVQGAVCALCGNVYGEPDPANHTRTELRNAVEAAAGVEGYTGDLYCKDCGALLETGSVIAALPEEAPEAAPKGITTGALVGIVFGSAAAAGAIAVGAYYLIAALRKPKAKIKKK